MSIKYYQLAKGEEMPDEFCVVRDVNGEPSEYMFYVPEAENDKLRELNEAMWLIIRCATSHTSAEDGLPVIHEDDLAMLRSMRRDLGIEVDG